MVAGRIYAQDVRGCKIMEPISIKKFLYDPDNPHCKECRCAECVYFYKNDGDCDDACYECDNNSHVYDCPIFEAIK
jgi:hypothetical protein